MKTYTIITTRYTGSMKSRETTGTMEELLKYFKYTLECGKCYESEKGNKKINMAPKTGKALVTQLNRAETNRSRNGCPSCSYELKVLMEA